MKKITKVRLKTTKQSSKVSFPEADWLVIADELQLRPDRVGIWVDDVACSFAVGIVCSFSGSVDSNLNPWHMFVPQYNPDLLTTLASLISILIVYGLSAISLKQSGKKPSGACCRSHLCTMSNSKNFMRLED